MLFSAISKTTATLFRRIFTGPFKLTPSILTRFPFPEIRLHSKRVAILKILPVFVVLHSRVSHEIYRDCYTVQTCTARQPWPAEQSKVLLCGLPEVIPTPSCSNMIIRCYRLNARPCFFFFFFFFFWGGGGGGGYQRIRKQVHVLWICIIYNNYGYPLLHCG